MWGTFFFPRAVEEMILGWLLIRDQIRISQSPLAEVFHLLEYRMQFEQCQTVIGDLFT
jgi:hypothetical protein